MRAELYGLPLCFTQVSDPTAVGAALLALYAIGAIPGFEELYTADRFLDRCIDPDSQRTVYYQERFNTYQIVLSR